MINIVVPMAGEGSRFAEAGYTDPKPLISVHGKSMIQLVIDNLTPRGPHKSSLYVKKSMLKPMTCVASYLNGLLGVS